MIDDLKSAGGEWRSLEDRAEHIADAWRSFQSNRGVRWHRVYDRALLHLKAVSKPKEDG